MKQDEKPEDTVLRVCDFTFQYLCYASYKSFIDYDDLDGVLAAFRGTSFARLAKETHSDKDDFTKYLLAYLEDIKLNALREYENLRGKQ